MVKVGQELATHRDHRRQPRPPPGAGGARAGRGRAARCGSRDPARKTSRRWRRRSRASRPTSPAPSATSSGCRTFSTAAPGPPRPATTPGRAATCSPPGSRAMKQSLARLRAGSRPEEIDASRARVAATEARIAQLEQQVKDATRHEPGGRRRDREDRGGRERSCRRAPPRGGDRPQVPRLAHRLRDRGPTSAASASARRRRWSPTTARRAREAHLRRLPGRVHAQERPDPRRAGEARLQGQGRSRQRGRPLQAGHARGGALRARKRARSDRRAARRRRPA